MLEDETGDTSAAAKKLKKEAVSVFTAFRFVTDTNTAVFWCRTDVVQKMKEGSWTVAIWRTDTYSKVTGDVAVKDGVVQGRLCNE